MDHIRSVHGFPKVITIETLCSAPDKSEFPKESEDFYETLNSNDDLKENANIHPNQSVKNHMIQTYKPHRFFKLQKDLEEHTHHNQENKNKHKGLTIWQNFAKCLLCGATDPHSHRPGVFRNRLEALEIVKGHAVLERKKLYKCGACEDLSFLHHLELSQHINQTHIGMNSWKMYQCGICYEKFTGKKYLSYHISEAHADNKPKHVECPICHIFISTKAILEKHCELVHDRKIKDLSRKIMLKEEGPEGEVFENDLPDVDYKGTQMVFCSLCDKTFASKSAMDKHLLFHSKKKPLEFKERTFSLEPNENDRYPCPLCNGIYITVESLTKHISSFHNNQENFGQDFEGCSCLKCDIVFSNRVNLRKHIRRVHEPIEMHQCKLCDLKVTTERSLKKHILTIHEGKSPFECKQCDAKYRTRATLYKHTREIHGKTFKCLTCFMRFSEASLLKNHEKVHERKKPQPNFKCFICKASYELKTDFAKHISEVHEGKKPLICPYCGINFTSIDLLTAHQVSLH
jgi:KRAB domain-containing zinc finger protein